jgi:pilus assembly protein Flp/PilA
MRPFIPIRSLISLEVILLLRSQVVEVFQKMRSRFQVENGASMVEYALLVVLIAIIAIVAVQIAGENVSTVFSSVAQSLGGAN